MTKLEIIKGRARLYFDPATAYMRLSLDSAGLSISDFTESELLDLEAAIRCCRRKMRSKC